MPTTPTTYAKYFGATLILLAASQPAMKAQGPQILPTVSTIATASSAGLSATISAAIQDAYGNTFISDTGNNVIRRVDAKGNVTVYAGGATAVCSAATDTYGDGCPATQATLNGPFAAHLYKGDLYIADYNNNRIRVVNGSTGIITTFAGDGTATNGASTATASCTAGVTGCGTKNPQDLAFDNNGNLFVVDGNGSPLTQRIDSVTKLQTLVAGNGKVGESGDGGLATSAEYQGSNGIAADSLGNIYIACQVNNNVRKVVLQNSSVADGNNDFIYTYVGMSSVGTAGAGTDGAAAYGQSDLSAPFHMAFDAAGNLYIADSANHRIRKVTLGTADANGVVTAGGIISTVVGTGAAGSTVTGLTAVKTVLALPYDVEFTPAGDMLVTDRTNKDVLLVRPDGHFAPTTVGTAATTQNIYALTQAASGTFSISGSSEFTVSATTCSASTVYGASGNICAATLAFTPSATGLRGASAVFTDSSSATVATDLTGTGSAPTVTLLPATITTIAGTGIAGETGDTAAATSAELNSPLGGVVDPSGNIYFADRANQVVRKISAASGAITLVAGNGTAGFSGDGGAATSATLQNPSAVAVDASGNLYIADTGNNRIRLVNALTGMISTFAGNGTAGFSGDGGPAASAELSSPSGLALSIQGVLYIADTGNNDIRYVGTRSRVIGTFAGNGMAAYAGDGSDAFAASLKSPAGVAVDAYGSVFIADTGNNVIRAVGLSGLVSTVAGTTIGSFNSDGPASTSNLNGPQGLAVDSADNLYIADTANNRIRLLSSSALFTVAGGASAGSTGDGALSSLASLSQPGSVFIDTAGNLVIADSANNKLRKIATGSSAVVFPTTNPGSTSVPQTLLALNSGLQSLTVSNPSVPSGFVLQPSGGVDCSSTSLMSSGTYCELQIAFAPPADGNYAGNLVLTDNAQGVTGATQSIGLTGVSASVFTANFTTGLPKTVVAGAAANVTVTVTNPSATYTGTLHFTSSDPNAKLPADYTFTTADVGSHMFTGISLASVGIQTLTVTDTATSTITATTSTTVQPGTATTLTIVSGNNQSVNLTASFQPLVVKATDAYGNPVSNATVTFTAPASGVSATFANGTSTTTAVSAATTGLASSSALKPVADLGTFTVLASSSGLSSVSFSLTNTSSIATSFAITPSSSTVPYGLQPGGTESVTLSVVPAGGFSAAVNLTCSSPVLTTCTVSPTSLTPTIGTATPFTVTLTGQRNADTEMIVTPAAIGLGIALLMTGFGFSRPGRIARLLLLLSAFSLTMGASGCGGATAKNVNTPNGLYPVVVTGTSGSLTSTATVTFYISGS